MSYAVRTLAAAALALGIMAAATPARAVAITSSLTNGALTFSLDTSFSMPCASSATSGNIAGSCANLDWSAAGNGFLLRNSVTNIIETTASGGPISYTDITLHFNVTSTIPNYLNGVTIALDGSGDITSVTDTVVGASGGTASAALGSAGAASGTPVRATVTASKSFSNTSSAAITLDMKASNGGSGGATVYTVTQTFAVPEPASAALLAVGIVSLALARRRARRVDPAS